MDTFEKVKAVIIKELDAAPEAVTPDASFTDDLGADSLRVMELVMAFEDEFDIKIPDEDSDKIQTVKQAVEYIEAKSKS